MQPSFWQRLGLFLRYRLPFALCAVLLLIEATPTHVTGFAGISPMLTVVGIYYWGVHRPDITGYGTAFLVGLLEDLMGATPLGVSSLTLIVSLMIVRTQERFFRDQSFAVTWWAFCIVAAIATLVRWLLCGLAQGDLSSPLLAFLAWGMTLIFYPIVVWIFTRIQLFALQEV